MKLAVRSLAVLWISCALAFCLAAQCQARPVVPQTGTGGAATGGSHATGGVIAEATGGTAADAPALPCECDKGLLSERVATANRPKMLRKPRIVGGFECADCPLSVVSIQDRDGWHYCTGILVDTGMVLTAAHCDPQNGDMIRVGSPDRTSGGEVRKVATTCRHPLYTQNPGWDALLVRLDRPVSVKPMALATSIPDVGRAMGWGVMSEAGTVTPIRLRAVDLKVASSVDCWNWDPTLATGASLCVGEPAGGMDTCYGDSGGPFASLVNGEWRLVAITSRGPGCAREGEWGVDTRVPDEPGSPLYDGVDKWVVACRGEPWP